MSFPILRLQSQEKQHRSINSVQFLKILMLNLQKIASQVYKEWLDPPWRPPYSKTQQNLPHSICSQCWNTCHQKGHSIHLWRRGRIADRQKSFLWATTRRYLSFSRTCQNMRQKLIILHLRQKVKIWNLDYDSKYWGTVGKSYARGAGRKIDIFVYVGFGWAGWSLMRSLFTMILFDCVRFTF